jgi:valyl-tRNA synthetase
MELSKHYDPGPIEDKWSQHWLKKGYFNSYPDERQAFTVVIPPPNVTGVLHMGHTLNETVQDILVRKARMSGFNACWVPGSDHASIATEARVVAMLKEINIEKKDLTREEYLNYAYEWRNKYGSIIYSQIEKLGCSVDWNRVAFTMDPEYYQAVITVFINLYKKQLIYRGARMVHWDPVAKTALSDEEVEYRELPGKLYYIKYKIIQPASAKDSTDGFQRDFIVIATQRPETIMGDVAVCVNPSDERYRHLKDKFVQVPLVNRRVPVIFDDYVDPAFGTGVLKITPAHDINDYNIGLKHNLPIIDTLNDDGTLSPAASVFVGMDRFEARKKAIAQLNEEGLLEKEEDYQTRLGYSQRTNAVVEPKISTQWFVRMAALAGPALEAVLDGSIRIHPKEKFLATYTFWLENVKDWCISRQLWWGQRIPAWYAPDGSFEVAATREEAFNQFAGRLNSSEMTFTIGDLFQDDDVLDTWFSSWLWPIEVFKGITRPNNSDLQYYYPASVLVTGQDIIFFWVARMIMAGMEFMKEKPFQDVYFTGMVRDKQGRKMSKSLGNSPDLLILIDKYGADAVRFGILISAPAGNDLLFDESALEQGRNFNNKIWNALKLVQSWETKVENTESRSSETIGGPGQTSKYNPTREVDFAIVWFENRLREVRLEIEKQYKEFRLSETLKTIYSLIWDDFCSWYLEWVKPGFGQSIGLETFSKTVYFFQQQLQLLHPFMPFITEEIYHLLNNQQDDLCVTQFGPIEDFNKDWLLIGEDLKLLISSVREFRQDNNLKNADPILRMDLPEGIFGDNHQVVPILKKQLNIEQISISSDREPTLSEPFSDRANPTSTLTFKTFKIRIQTEKQIDHGQKKQELLKEIVYLKGFLDTVNKKLSNDRFVQNAKPEVLALEQKKKSDAEIKIRALEENLSAG